MNIMIDSVVLTPDIYNVLFIVIIMISGIILCITGILWAMWPQLFSFRKKKGEK